ncbi:MAG: SprB repeat-containing protein, partial [Bacteroidia bacterium]|nr:SprB repeat-containing protein [Bacteroidia bacterium]
MKKLLLNFLLILVSITAGAQVFWTENFGTGCSTGTLAAGYSGSNGIWTVASTGTNQAYSNIWYVSAEEAGMAAGVCSDGCGGNPGLTNRTVHIGSNPSLIGDAGAAYFAGPLSATTNIRVESPVINCSGQASITVAFKYIMEGQAGVDYAALAFYDGTAWTYYNGSSWTLTVASLPPSNNSACSPQGTWTAYSVALPSNANNNPNVKIGFQWTNNNDGVGTDPSFAADDVTLNGTAVPSCSVQISQTQAISCFGDCNGALLATANGTGTITYLWSIGPPVPFGNISNLCAGTYTVTITDNAACSATASFALTQPGQLVIQSATVSSVACFGDCTGSATPIVTGGTPPYLVPQQINLCAGFYTVTVSDANACTTSASFVITEPPLLVLGNLITTNPSCVGCSDGSICLGTNTGGVPPYTFSISPSATFNGNCFINLPDSVYT